MRITIYRTELNENKHNILVKESASNYPIEMLNNPKSIVDMLNVVFGLDRQAEEHVVMIAFNTKCKVLGVFEISHGTVNASICEPRDIFIKALLCGATHIVIAHNHPSGDATPSKQDMECYNRVKQSGEMLGIKMVDNLIIGDGAYISFTERGF